LTFIQGKVTEIDREKSVVKVGEEQEVPYDVLVVATGSRHVAKPSPDDGAEPVASFVEKTSKLAQEIGEGSSVVVIGGGLTGVEAAAELAIAHPSLTVHLVHPGPQLLVPPTKEATAASSTLSAPPLREKLLKKVAEKVAVHKNLRVHLGVRVETPAAPPSLTLSDGTQLDDVAHIVWATGARISVDFGADWPRERESKRLEVDASLRLSGSPNVFVVGDAGTGARRMLVAHASAQGEWLGKLLAKTSFPLPASLPAYKAPFDDVAFVTLGPADGAAQLPPGWVVGRRLVVAAKAGDFFTARTLKTIYG
jgi:NADH dehydrogenase FAD-containing subunit